MNGSVMGIASTTDWDARASCLQIRRPPTFAIGLRGATPAVVVSTFPGGTYAALRTNFSSPLVEAQLRLLLSASPSRKGNWRLARSPTRSSINPELQKPPRRFTRLVSAWVNSAQVRIVRLARGKSRAKTRPRGCSPCLRSIFNGRGLFSRMLPQLVFPLANLLAGRDS